MQIKSHGKHISGSISDTADVYHCFSCPEYSLYDFKTIQSEYIDIDDYCLSAQNNNVVVFKRDGPTLYNQPIKLTSQLAIYWRDKMKLYCLLS